VSIDLKKERERRKQSKRKSSKEHDKSLSLVTGAVWFKKCNANGNGNGFGSITDGNKFE
jgi:hypothetical protein